MGDGADGVERHCRRGLGLRERWRVFGKGVGRWWWRIAGRASSFLRALVAAVSG